MTGASRDGGEEVVFRQRVVAIVALLGGRAVAKGHEVEAAVHACAACDDRAGAVWPPVPKSKEDKRAAKSIADAMQKLELNLVRKTHGDADLRSVIHRATYGSEDEFAEWRAQLARWRELFLAFAGTLERDEPSFFPSDGSGWPLGHQRKSTKKLVAKRAAAEQAARLLQIHGLPLSVTRVSGKNGSVFCRVAALLYGDRTADLSYQCNKIRKRESGV